MLSTQWSGWVPAYWRPGQEAHIVDVTGGGNAFIGGLLAGLMLTNDHRAGTLSRLCFANISNGIRVNRSIVRYRAARHTQHGSGDQR